MARTERFSVPRGARSLDCYAAFPGAHRGGSPTVLVVHEIFGPDAHIEDVCRRFAAHGYVAVAPNLFAGELARILTAENIRLAIQSFAGAPPGLRRDPAQLAAFAATQPPERRPALEAFGRISSPSAQAGFATDLLEVSRHLRTRPEVDPARVGTVGFCFGGAMAARLATVDPELRAAVIFYGQNPPLEDVPAIRAAVLGLYGGEDPGITDTVPALAEAMKRAGLSFESHVYPGAKHAFFNDTRAGNFDAPSATDAWGRVLAFFARTLAEP
ncbi:MAG TPA: dienelactone hydrolase family protein [Thermoplasmata archaeon]|nr:dienelactone hydrolase family protein [Thermoplasmata archaeon]